MSFDDSNYLSPFNSCTIVEGDLKFNSVYHYYVYKKFLGSDAALSEMILKAGSKQQLVALSDTRHVPVIDGWDSKKYNIMKSGYILMFNQHKELMDMFKTDTKYHYDYEMSAFSYWGCFGSNRMNKMLCDVRKEFRFSMPSLLERVLEHPQEVVDVAVGVGKVALGVAGIVSDVARLRVGDIAEDIEKINDNIDKISEKIDDITE
jgi:predicted NAD-dependent protein-ADP-ribosyltransferase YbiA (DUF1768 family)